MNRFCIGDIHGNYQALLEVMSKSNFDYVKDKLIVLGDVVDGHPCTKEVIDELEFLLLPEEEYEDEDRKYDEYKDDKLTI